MALLERRKDPTARELRWFGLVVWPFFLLIAALLYFRAELRSVAVVVLSAGTAWLVLYTLIEPLRRPCFLLWMAAVHPLGWLLSHLLLGLVYYLLITPIGLLLRLAGHDPTARKFEPDRATMWHERQEAPPPERYFRQF